MKQELISSIRFRVKSLPLGSNESEAIRKAILEDVEALEALLTPAPVVTVEVFEEKAPKPTVEPVLIEASLEVAPETEQPAPSLYNDITQAIPPLPPVEEAPDNAGSPESERRPARKRK